LYLEDLLVTEALRGKGIGSLLFDRLIEECRLKKYIGMVWQVLDWNEPAINFYKKYNANLDPEWVNGSLCFD
jgi:GNAT superfamily N-acetyltransferase